MTSGIEGGKRALGALEVGRPEQQAALVGRCVSGEPGAWRAFHDGYQSVVTAYLRHLGVREDELEDASQEVFLQTFRYPRAFRGDAQLATWLYRLCATEARKARERGRQAAAAREVLERETEAPAVSSAEMSHRWANERVGAALGALTRGERQVFALFEIRGLAGKEVAEIAGCPVATVWRRLHEARQTFRAAIEESRN